MKKSSGFFYKTLSIIVLVSVGFQIVVISALSYYMLIPLGKSATNDLSNIIIYTTEKWQQLNTNQRQNFSQQVLKNII